MTQIRIPLWGNAGQEFLGSTYRSIHVLMMVSENKAHQLAIFITFMYLAAHRIRANIVPYLWGIRRCFPAIIETRHTLATLLHFKYSLLRFLPRFSPRIQRVISPHDGTTKGDRADS